MANENNTVYELSLILSLSLSWIYFLVQEYENSSQKGNSTIKRPSSSQPPNSNTDLIVYFSTNTKRHENYKVKRSVSIVLGNRIVQYDTVEYCGSQ